MERTDVSPARGLINHPVAVPHCSLNYYSWSKGSLNCEELQRTLLIDRSNRISSTVTIFRIKNLNAKYPS